MVIAHSFARIFYRNGFNMGLVLLEIGDKIEEIKDGDELQIDAVKGEIKNKTTGQTIKTAPIPEFMQEILQKGGLINYVRDRLKG